MQQRTTTLLGLTLLAILWGCSSDDDTGEGANGANGNGANGGGNDSDGQSGVTCPAGQTACAGACVSLSDSPAHCGECGRACSAGQTCVAGACSCAPGFTDCGGPCVNLTTDGANCGECGNVCAAPLVCSLGQCSDSCAEGLTQCGSSCVDASTDAANCGGCGQACPVGQVCIHGSCGCDSGLTFCNGSCTNTFTDPANCGACGNVCAAGGSCIQGQCSGGSSGPAVPGIDASVPDDACMTTQGTAENVPPVLMFVVDTSLSMDEVTETTGGMTKWEATQIALADAFATMPSDYAVGILYYPNSPCINREVAVDIAPLTADQVAALTASLNRTPDGGTPTHDAWLLGRDTLDTQAPPTVDRGSCQRRCPRQSSAQGAKAQGCCREGL